MTSHTPGPWTVNDAEGLWIAPADENANVICDIVGRLQRDALPGGYTAEDDANARLIGAAPELLAVCRAVLAFKGMAKSSSGMDIWDKAKAAIAKAEGR